MWDAMARVAPVEAASTTWARKAPMAIHGMPTDHSQNRLYSGEELSDELLL